MESVSMKIVQCKEFLIKIRQETSNDYNEVYQLVKASFATENHTEESDYLNEFRTRKTLIPELSLVAQLDNGIIIGQITLYETIISCDNNYITQLVL
jgi:predicted N-acetyltransferase YhbS